MNRMKNNRKSFSISDQIFFAQRLSLLLNSNISLIESLNIMKSMDISKKRKQVYEMIIDQCEQGISLSKSLISTRVKFDPLLITLIKNGEYSGSLSVALAQVSKNLEKRNELKKKVISTLIYPSFIFIATICMSLFLVLYIFPKILPMLSSMNIKLPLLTVAVKNLYEFSISYGLQTALLIIVILIMTSFLIRKVSHIRKAFHKLLIGMPILGNYIKLSILESLCGIGEMLLSSGRSLSDYHIFVIDSINNVLYKEAFREIHLQSIQGVSFSNSMSRYPTIFMQTMVDMCAIGEKTGDLALMLGHCSRIFEQDIELFFKRFSALIEPVLMIFMGLIVGSIALSIILPVYEITNHLTK
jgi:type IV pilus assembly protein PilC